MLEERIKIMAQSTVRIMLLVLAIVGLLQMLAIIFPNRPTSPFKNLAQQNPKLLEYRYISKSIDITDEHSAQEHWQALQPTLEILTAINPNIATWISDLHDRNRIIWTKQPTLFNWPVIASYVWYIDEFYFGPDFWKLPEGEKAAVIAHEYFHHQQSKIAMIADTAVEALTLKLPDYGSRIEDEAHLYQWFTYRAMNMEPTPIVRGYFRHRKILFVE